MSDSGAGRWQVFLDLVGKLPPERQAVRLAGLAREMLTHGERDAAVEQALRARALARRHGTEDEAVIASVLSALTAKYHVKISTDPDRLAAWQRAVAAVTRPGMLVLEIGTGSGILAMLAARAGADVVSCDDDRIIAAIAEDVIAANNLADRVRIVAQPVKDLHIGRDLPRPADVLMLDLFGDHLFDFTPFQAIAAARPLLREGAITLPMQVSLHAALADCPDWARFVPGEIAGFDLTDLAAVRLNSIIVHESRNISLRSAPDMMLNVDLSGELPAAKGDITRPFVSEGGRVNGVAAWIRLTLAPGCVLEPRPGATPPEFYANASFYPFLTELATRPGDAVPIAFAWQGKTLAVTMRLRRRRLRPAPPRGWRVRGHRRQAPAKEAR